MIWGIDLTQVTNEETIKLQDTLKAWFLSLNLVTIFIFISTNTPDQNSHHLDKKTFWKIVGKWHEYSWIRWNNNYLGWGLGCDAIYLSSSWARVKVGRERKSQKKRKKIISANHRHLTILSKTVILTHVTFFPFLTFSCSANFHSCSRTG